MPDGKAKPDPPDGGRMSGDPELAELRRAVLALAHKLGSLGAARVEDIGKELEEESESLVREGRRLAQDLRERGTRLEDRVEHAVRAHPAEAVAALLGTALFGLILGLVLRRRD